jgi:acetyltransferase-like isoleucine patch superfamily enzyme
MNRFMQRVRKLLRPAGRYVRVILYRLSGVRIGEGSRIQRPYLILSPESLLIGENSIIYPDAYITPLKEWAGLRHTPEIKIGNGVYIGRHAYFAAIDSIEIADGCVLSEYVYITDHAHGFHPERGPIMEQPLESKGPVHIGRNCFLGFRVSIMPGVTLGDHCVVGANSVVTRSFPAYSMIAGCPAKVVKVFSIEAGTWVQDHLK